MPALRYVNTTTRLPAIRIAFDVHAWNDGRGFAEDIFLVVEMKRNSGCSFQCNPTYGQTAQWRSAYEGRDCYTIQFHGLTLPPGTGRSVLSLGIDAWVLATSAHFW